MPATLPSEFVDLKARYFDRLCLTLGLTGRPLRFGDGFAIASADLDPVRVFLDYERGLGHFSIGPTSDDAPLCSIEDIAARLPRVRTLPIGAQRLTLEEQISLIERNWADLVTMLSGPGLAETRAWNEARKAAYTSRCSGAAN
ncbi:MAG: hypothetical protein JSS86_19020 [Cyanobacteria bacterium SZAS LIN-2]|nr:hypothetical protein [Cyanobacteria bacterium SZAS LIN-2]